MKKRMVSALLALTLIISSGTMVFADIDYSQWDSQAGYPSDVVGTEWLTPVKFLMDKKIITGDTDGLFHPEKNITRAELAVVMVKATNHTSNLAEMEKKNIFNDLDGYGWAKGYINAAEQAGLIKGVGDSKFAPGANVTYAEAITIIIRMKASAAELAEGMAPAWPENYIQYAQIYNVLGSVVVRDWNAPAPKGDVVKLLYRSMPKNVVTYVCQTPNCDYAGQESPAQCPVCGGWYTIVQE